MRRAGSALPALSLEALGGDQNIADAGAALEEAYAILLRQRGAKHADTRRVAGQLAAHYEALDLRQPDAGHANTAREWRERQGAG